MSSSLAILPPPYIFLTFAQSKTHKQKNAGKKPAFQIHQKSIDHANTEIGR
jgi:hypothetical protein